MTTLPILVRHIFLDVDGTLVDFRASLRAGTEAAAAHLSQRTGLSIAPTSVQETVRRLAGGGRLGFSEVRRRAYAQVLLERGVHDDSAVGAAAAEALERDYEARLAALRAYDDVAPALEALRDRGFILVAATNGTPALERTPIHGLLHHTWTAAEAAVSKPHPDFYLGALARVGADPTTSLMVGDRLDNDVEAAHAVGIATILIDRYGDHEVAPPPALALIHTLTELPPLVQPIDEGEPTAG